MKNEEVVQVFLDIAGTPYPIGKLWFHYHGGRESTSFQYDEMWLSGPFKFSIDPELPAYPGLFHSDALFGVFSDAAPDRWGRLLMRKGDMSGRTLSTYDYLLRVDDDLRMGALRFRIGNGPFLAEKSRVRVPPLTDLPRLVVAAQRLDAGNDDQELEDIQLLLRPGASLGGAHPKAVVTDSDGSWWIAKFPGVHAEDRYRSHWEYLSAHLARRSGIHVPDHRLIHLPGNVAAFLTKRFDRDDNEYRIQYASAMTILGARDGDTRSYEEIAETLRELKVPIQDIQELWRRLVFFVLVSNVDDHLRNHGVIWSPATGLRLSPAFDINPASPSQDRTVHGTTLRFGGSAKIDFAMVWAAAKDFLLQEPDARAMIQKMIQVISTWIEEAKRERIPKSEIDRWSGAFIHEDFHAAMAVAQGKLVNVQPLPKVVKQIPKPPSGSWGGPSFS